MSQICILFFAMTLFSSPAFAFTKPVEDFIKTTQLNAKDNNNSSLAEKAFKNRVVSEFTKPQPNYEMVVACLSELKKADSLDYEDTLSDIPHLFKKSKPLGTLSNSDENAFFGFLEAMSLTVSAADALQVAYTVFPDKTFYKFARNLINANHPEAFTVLFEKNESSFSSGAKARKLRAFLGLYVEAAYLLGNLGSAMKKIDSYARTDDGEWLKVVKAMATLYAGDLAGADAQVAKLFPGKEGRCEGPKTKIEANAIFLATLFRLHKNYAASETCLAKIKSNTAYAVVYQLQMAKTGRLRGTASSTKYLTEAQKLVDKKSKPLDQVKIKFEKLENLALLSDAAPFQAAKAELNDLLKDTKLELYQKEIPKIESYLKAHPKFYPLDTSSLEALEFSVAAQCQASSCE